MNKYERLEEIIKMVNQKGTVRTSEIVEALGVTDMTVRRDLAELEEQGALKKIHGGARSNSAFQYKEASHKEKHTYNIEAKQAIALKAVELIEEGDTLFLGPGTTVEFLATQIYQQTLSVVTNCLPVFNLLFQKTTESFRVYLLGGEMRQVTESFVGEITNTSLEKMRFSKMFFSGNGVKDGEVMTSSVGESYTQRLALKHSVEKYLLIDSSKVGKEDFTAFCHLSDLTAVVTDDLDEEKRKKLANYTEVIY